MKKTKKTDLKTVWCVSCEYPYTYDYDLIDKKLNKLIGRNHDSSGTGFGFRDVSWDFKTQKKGIEAFNKLAGVKGIGNIKINKVEY